MIPTISRLCRDQLIILKPPDSSRNRSNFLNWNFGVVYKPRADGNIYAALSTSSNPPGEQVDAGTSASYGGLPSGYQDFEPERNISYEIGAKWNLLQEKLISRQPSSRPIRETSSARRVEEHPLDTPMTALPDHAVSRSTWRATLWIN